MTAAPLTRPNCWEVFAYYQGETGSSDADQGTLLRFVEAGVISGAAQPYPAVPTTSTAVGEGCVQLLGSAWYPACGGQGVLGTGWDSWSGADWNDKNQLLSSAYSVQNFPLPRVLATSAVESFGVDMPVFC
jgi:hypothetical protein